MFLIELSRRFWTAPKSERALVTVEIARSIWSMAVVAPEAEQLRVEVENELQRRMSGYEVNLSYQDDVSSWVIQIRDPDSGDVVFQIPPEQMVRLRDRLQEVLKETGLLVDNTT